MKTCRSCKERLPLSMFYRHPTERDGVQFRCKECHKAAMRKRRADVREYRVANGLIKPRPRPVGNLKHGHKRMKWQSPEHHSWQAMRARCLNKNSPDFRLYGGRGITVCERWKDFTAFLADMGPRPKGMSLDRINNNGNYEPDNCRWATAKQQAANRRRSNEAPANHPR